MAVVDPAAKLGAGVRIGPFCTVGPEVSLSAGVILKSHVVVAGNTEIGEDSVLFPFSSVGEVPQDRKFQGEKTRLVIGARNRIREYVTINPGTEGGGGITSVGDDGLFLAGSHIAHDCRIGNRVTLVNNASIAGHCVIEDDVTIGGLSGVHQFVRIGRGAMIGAVTMVTADVVPYGLVQGPRGHLDGLNFVGLKRRGASRDEIHALRELMARLAKGPFREAARQLAEGDDLGERERQILDFILGPSERSFLVPQG